MRKHRIFIIQFTEGELAELLIIIRGEAQKSLFYPDYWNKLAGRIQEQADEQIKAGDAFQCAACFEQLGDNLTNQASVTESERSFTTR